MRRSKRRHAAHIWVPLADLLLIVVAALILTRPHEAPRERMYRSLEGANLAQASNDGGSISSAEDVIKLESSGMVMMRGERIEIAELSRRLARPPVTAHYVLAIADTAQAGDAQRVELILRDAGTRYTRVFKKQDKHLEGLR
jgi:hypothetical protein